MKYYLNKALAWFLYFTVLCPKFVYKFLYIFVIVIGVGLLPVATAQLMSGEEISRRLRETERKTESHEKKITEFSVAIAQNNLLIQQSIEDRRDIKAIQSGLIKSINYAEGALYLIKLLLLFFTPLISILQLIQMYSGKRRDRLLEDLLQNQRALFMRQEGKKISESFNI